ncbi:hypothetical protein [Alicyclobacillus acidiphilus]|uniref:hypothetical protein n=1 Tax=Alicyclobacillus acidiphilus TaxID=182455 RepID=UPI000837A6FE|nr:hypothetical protein [Alicyclobacillus acidiphilus]
MVIRIAAVVVFAIDVGLFIFIVHHNERERAFYQRISYSFWKLEDGRVAFVDFRGKPLRLDGIFDSDGYNGGTYTIMDQRHHEWRATVNSSGKVVRAVETDAN